MSLNLNRISAMVAALSAAAAQGGGFRLNLQLPSMPQANRPRGRRKPNPPGSKLARKTLEHKAGAHH